MSLVWCKRTETTTITERSQKASECPKGTNRGILTRMFCNIYDGQSASVNPSNEQNGQDENEQLKALRGWIIRNNKKTVV